MHDKLFVTDGFVQKTGSQAAWQFEKYELKFALKSKKNINLLSFK